MQTFFEDGPKRDRRLWIGDLRLEALTNYYTFKNTEIVKRCLYLFAAGECNSIGFLPSFIYETPYYHSGATHIEDYAMHGAVHHHISSENMGYNTENFLVANQSINC